MLTEAKKFLLIRFVGFGKPKFRVAKNVSLETLKFVQTGFDLREAIEFEALFLRKHLFYYKKNKEVWDLV